MLMPSTIVIVQYSGTYGCAVRHKEADGTLFPVFAEMCFKIDKVKYSIFVVVLIKTKA